MVSRQRLAELFRYGIASGVSAAITLGLPVLLHERFAVDPRVAVGIALCIAFVVNFFMTRLFVFRSGGGARGELLRFAGTSVAFRLAEYGVFLVLFSAGIVYWAAQVMVVGTSFVLKFFAYRTFVYGRGPRPDPVP